MGNENSDYDIKKIIVYRLKRRVYGIMEKYLIKGIKIKIPKIDFEAIAQHLMPYPEDINQYQIDHIKPINSFDMKNPSEFKMAFSPENHQWLSKQDNLKKGNGIGKNVVRVGISLRKEVFAEINKVRGNVPFSTYLSDHFFNYFKLKDMKGGKEKKKK